MAIKDKNKIIIQFMGDGIARDYDKSWDSLMLVVDKIESLNNNLCGFTIHKSQVELFYGNQNFSFTWTELNWLGYKAENKFDILYYGVTHFIEWYNENIKSE